jgi:hypothetical protein
MKVDRQSIFMTATSCYVVKLRRLNIEINISKVIIKTIDFSL